MLRIKNAQLQPGMVQCANCPGLFSEEDVIYDEERGQYFCRNCYEDSHAFDQQNRSVGIRPRETYYSGPPENY